MNRARKAGLALICVGVFSTMGCCYHGQNFGSSRDIGLGKLGCATCVNSDSSCSTKSTCAVGVTDEEDKRGRLTATASQQEPPQAPAAGASVHRPVHVVQPERVSTGLVVNATKVISPLPNLPAQEIPMRDTQPKKD